MAELSAAVYVLSVWMHAQTRLHASLQLHSNMCHHVYKVACSDVLVDATMQLPKGLQLGQLCVGMLPAASEQQGTLAV